MSEKKKVFIYEKDGVYQASRVKLDRFIIDAGEPVVGVEITRKGAIEQLEKREAA